MKDTANLSAIPILSTSILRFAALLVYLQVLPTLLYVKSHGTNGSPVISPEALEALLRDWRYPFSLNDVRVSLGHCATPAPISRLAAGRR